MESKLPELYPVVIPPISHPPFHCQGKGLVYKERSRESVETLRSWFTDKRKNSHLQQPKDWWRAQLLLYGLNAGKSNTKLAELTEMLKTAVLNGLQGPTKEILDLEGELDRKFRLLNAEERDRKYLALETDDSRAEFDLKRFLQERFPTKGKRKKDDLVILNLRNRYPVHTAAESLGLCSISADAPGAENACWIIVGYDRDVILERKSQIEVERNLWELEQEKSRNDKVKAKRQEVKDIARELEAKIGQGKGVLRDVVGEWHVESPAISREWPQLGTEFGMSIYFHRLEDSDTDSDEGRSYDSSESTGNEISSAKLDGTELLWANFDLGLVHGVLHANAQLSHSDPFPSKPIPVSWRGRDFSEGQIQLNTSSENRATLTFLSSTKLKGVLKDCSGTFKFTGYKVSTAPTNKVPEEWNKLTARQWNIECKARWH